MPVGLREASVVPAANRLSVSLAETASEWNSFVETHWDTTVYHLWEWREVFEAAFGHRSAYLIARRDGTVAGVLPLVLFDTRLFGRFVVSLPFVNYGGVLADDPVVGSALLHEAIRFARRAGASHVELRHRRRRFEELPAKQHKVAMLLPLAADAGKMWSILDRKVRNQIRKGEKSGVTVGVGGAECLDDFYGVFARNMRDLGTPVYGRRFFAAVLEHLAPRARVIVVRQRDLPVAAAISLRYRRSVEVPWASSLQEFRALCPNHLLYWEVIRRAIADGNTTLDFGRSTPGGGTYHYKRQWGALPSPLWWEYHLESGRRLPDQSPSNPRYRMAVAVWKRLPLAMANRVGPSIVRCLP